MSPFPAWVVIAVGVASIVWETRGRLIRLVGPLATTQLALISIFGIRPLVDRGEREQTFYGMDVAAGHGVAQWVGVVATGYVALGAWLARREPDPERVEQPSGPPPPGRSAYVWLLTAGMVPWLVLVTAAHGGVRAWWRSFGGRTREIEAQLSGVPEFVSAIPVGTALALCTLFVWRNGNTATRPGRRERVVHAACLAACAAPSLALGGRRLLLPIVIAGVAAWCWGRPTARISWRGAVLALAAAAMLATVPFVRSAGARRDGENVAQALIRYQAEQGLPAVAEQFLLSYDTEMYQVVSVFAARADLPGQGAGWRWLLHDAALTPLPASVLADHGLALTSEQVLIELFGAGCLVDGSPCPVPSLPGVLFYDLSFVGVAAGMTVWGYAAARWSRGLGTARRPERVLAGLALAGYAPVLVRGNPVAAAWLLTNVWGVGRLLWWSVGRWAGSWADASVTDARWSPSA